MKRRENRLWMVMWAVLLAGCAARPRPDWAAAKPTVIDTTNEDARERAELQRGLATLASRDKASPCDVLALSSGGQTGAFGAGLIEGWTARGNRPEFGLVTGVSTGAMIAVFAFLGPEGDATLRELYTRHGQSDVISTRWWVELPLADSYARSSPLHALIARYVSDDVVQRVGEQAGRGRVLLVCTANLDLCRLRVWNLTELAADASVPLADRAAKFRAIVMASMSIPSLMPPVFLDGQMHVDGGVVRQLFLTDREHAADLRRALGDHPRFWVIANRPLKTPPRVVGNHMIPISARSIQLLMDASLEKDLEEARRFAADCGGTFAVATIQPDPTAQDPQDRFDPKFMRLMHEVGMKSAMSGTAWGEWERSTAAKASGGPAATAGP